MTTLPTLTNVIFSTDVNIHTRLRTQSSGEDNMTLFSGKDSSETFLLKVPPASQKTGLYNPRALLILGFWYFFSFTTLVLNKYVLSYQDGDPIVLGACQMLACFLIGYAQLRWFERRTKQSIEVKHHDMPWRLIGVVGALRFQPFSGDLLRFGNFLFFLSNRFVPVSFAETVKSSAPVFTVVLSRLVLDERTTWMVNCSLIPVMFGLALCSANELSFNAPGFASSLATNLSECFQNVFSKRLLSDDRANITPVHLQTYSSVFSFIVVIPALIFFSTNPYSAFSDSTHFCTLVAASISFHLQSYVEYMLLGFISPVTHSVANTVKRALMIWLSVLVFGNPVTFLSGLGTMVVIGGVLMYNHAREIMAKDTQYNVQLNTVKVTDHHI